MKFKSDVTGEGSLTLLDPTGSDGAGARQRSITLQGKTLAGVLHSLLKILAQHEGSAADQKAEVKVYVNAGSDGTSPTLVATIASSGVFTFAQTPAGLLTAAAAAAAYQPLDADLTAIAGVSTDPFGRALLALTNAAGLRTAAALGTVATLDVDIDGTLAANSDGKVASQKATKTYVDTTVGAAVVGLLDDKGNTDCSGNPNYPAALKGDIYTVSVAGKIGGASGVTVEIGDTFRAIADNAGGTQASVGTSWTVLQANLVGALVNGGPAGTPSSITLTNGTGLPAATGLTGQTPIGNGGTGQSTAGAAFDALSIHAADVASAGTTNLDSVPGLLIDVTGTTNITAITLAEGHHRIVRFTGALTLTNGASLVLPGGANITTAAGDFAIVVGYAAGVVRCASYVPAGALPINRGGTGQVTAVAAKDALSTKSGDIASAATTDLSTATGDFVDITGTTNISALGTCAAGVERTCRFTGSGLTLTYNATSLILPGACDLPVLAGDVVRFRSLGSGNWQAVGVFRAGVGLEFWIVMNSTVTLPNDTNLNAIFTDVGAGTFTLPAGLYEFEVGLVITSMSGTSGNGQFDFKGAGGATIDSSPFYLAWGGDGNPNVSGTLTGSSSTNVASAANVVGAATGTGMFTIIRGMMRVTAAGTVIPSIKQTTGAAAVVGKNSYCKFTMKGSATQRSYGPVT